MGFYIGVQIVFIRHFLVVLLIKPAFRRFILRKSTAMTLNAPTDKTRLLCCYAAGDILCQLGRVVFDYMLDWRPI